MSSGAECNFVEVKPNEWFLRLQQYPYGANENYDSYGPFKTFDDAYERLSDFQNPGGYSTDVHSTHKHEYHNVMDWDGDTISQCVGCSQREPDILDCGCIDYHKSDCDDFVVHVDLRLYVSSLRGVLDGSKDLELVLPQLQSAWDRLQRQGF